MKANGGEREDKNLWKCYCEPPNDEEKVRHPHRLQYKINKFMETNRKVGCVLESYNAPRDEG